MNISQINQNPNYKSVSFGSASDITLKYMLEKHSKYLPERMRLRIIELLQEPNKVLPKFYELHREVYAPLMQADSLDKAKKDYPEFSDVLELTTLANNRSKAIKAVNKIMPLEQFSLDLLKKLYKPSRQEDIANDYGFTNRSLLVWLCNKLHVKKLDGNYLQLLKMSIEEENKRIAELSRQAIYRDPITQQKRQIKAAEHHRTPEYRTKKKQEMIDFYKRNPERAERVRELSIRTWELCPDVKTAFAIYTNKLTPFVRKIMSKKQLGAKLTTQEQRVVKGYYKNFWESNPNFRKVYSEARKQAAIDLGITSKSIK